MPDGTREWDDPTGVDNTDSTASASAEVRVGVVLLGAWALAYTVYLGYHGEYALSLTAFALAVLLYLAVTAMNLVAVWLAAVAGEL